jgi:transcriptional regulator with XRE-family HTH domain
VPFAGQTLPFDCGCIDTIHSNLKYFVGPMSTQTSVNERQILTPAELGSAISELRSLRRKTQSEVATALSVDRSQLAHLEGGRSGRYLAHLLNILDFLGAELHIHWKVDPAGTKAPLASRPSTSKAKSPTRPSPDSAQRDSAQPDSAQRDFAQLEPNPKSIAETKTPEATESSPAPILELAQTPTPGELTPETAPESTPETTPESTPETAPESTTESAREPTSAQLTKITNQAMNVMAASQRLSGGPRPTPTTPA